MKNQEQIFKDWVERYKGVFHKVARSYAHNAEDHSDLLQDIYLQIWLALPSFRRECSEITWIYRVALNTALLWLRGQGRQRRKAEKVVELHHAGMNQLDPANDKAAVVEHLYSAIRQLPVMDASLILMSLDGLEYREMAGVLGITATNVGVRLTRAKAHLKELMPEDLL